MIKKEILYCNLTILFKGKKLILKEVVYKDIDGYYKNIRLGITEKSKVLSVEKIKSLGFENISKGFDIGVKSEEKRNNITGAYE